MDESRTSAIAKGFLAGLVAGAAGGWAKLQCEAIYPPRPDGREAPPGVLIRRAAQALDMEASDAAARRGTFAIHWAFSVAFGGVYGALVEVAPIVRSLAGVPYGLSVWIGAHELMIPALTLSPPASRLSATEHRSEAFSHAGYGLAQEIARALLRRTILR